MPERDLILDRERRDGGPEAVAVHAAIHRFMPDEAFTPEQIVRNIDPDNPESVVRLVPETGAFCRVLRQEARQVLWIHWLFPQDAGVSVLYLALLGALARANRRWPETRAWNAEAVWTAPDEGRAMAERWSGFVATAGLGAPEIVRYHFPEDSTDRFYALIRWPSLSVVRALRRIKGRRGD